MANNAPGQSTQSAYRLGPSLSLDRGASLFAIGECVLIRIPEEIQVEGYVENEATAVGTDLPPVSTGSSSQHFAFVREVRLQLDRSMALEVYPVLSFTSTGGALSTYNRMSDTAKAALLPLPPLSSRYPTPDAFGEPLDFGNWSTFEDSFLYVFPRQLNMPTRRSVSLSLMIGSVFLIAVVSSLNEWTLPSSCLCQCCSASIVTENTRSRPQVLRIMMINSIPLSMAGAEMNKEALTRHMDKPVTEGRRLPE